MKRLLAFLFAFFLLLLGNVLGEDEMSWEEEEVEEEWEELPDDPPETLLATDVFYHMPNELSAVKCDHEVCFWKLEMGRMKEDAIWEVLTQPVTVLEGKQREQVRILAEQPVEGIRYGFFNYGKVNLYNAAGLPLCPFQRMKY